MKSKLPPIPSSSKGLQRSFCFGIVACGMIHAASAATVAHFRFEEGTSGGAITNAVDSSGNGNSMINTGSLTYGTAVPGPIINPGGLSNSVSASFPGGGNYLRDANPTTSSLATDTFLNFTIEGFVNFGPTLEGVESLVGKLETTTGAEAFRDGFFLNKFFQNQFRVEVATVGGNYLLVQSPDGAAAINTWYHVAAVGDSVAGTLTLYVNYAQVGQAAGFDGLFVADLEATGSTWLIGASAINDGQVVDTLNGSIDEVRFSNTALAPSAFLTAVPEPSSGLALLSGLGLLAIRRRR